MATATMSGTRAVLRHAHFSAYKAREVLNLIRGKSVGDAYSELVLCERGPSEPIAKLLQSAVANAGHNDGIPPEELFVSECFVDEGPTMRRFRPRARGRATRIRKRSCHITIVVSRYSLEQLETKREAMERSGRQPADAASTRARRVAQSRKAAASTGADEAAEVAETEAIDATVEAEAVETAVVEAEVVETVEAEPTDSDNDAADSADATDAEGDEAAASGVLGFAGVSSDDSGDESADDSAPYGAGSHAPLPDNSQPDGYPIKGNADSMLYHVPGGSHYGRTIAEVWFATEEDAERAGFSPTPSSAKKDEN